jgi:hypothetical protein
MRESRKKAWRGKRLGGSELHNVFVFVVQEKSVYFSQACEKDKVKIKCGKRQLCRNMNNLVEGDNSVCENEATRYLAPKGSKPDILAKTTVMATCKKQKSRFDVVSALFCPGQHNIHWDDLSHH